MPPVDTVNLVQMGISLTIIQVYVKSMKRNVLPDNIITLQLISACIAKKTKYLITLAKNANSLQLLVHRVNTLTSLTVSAKAAA